MTGLFGAAPEPMSLWAMLGGGLLAFVSPCVLPMLPVYAMYLLGGTDAAPGRLRVLRRCLGLLCGFVLLFTLMGAGAGALGSLLKNTDRGTLDIVTGVLMLLFGVWMLDVIHIHLPAVPGLGGRQPSMNGFVGSFLFGLLIAISWTPCLTPVLANALVLAASADNATMWTGIVSLAVFAAGIEPAHAGRDADVPVAQGRAGMAAQSSADHPPHRRRADDRLWRVSGDPHTHVICTLM